MAAAVLFPGRAVHPVLGSIFSAAAPHRMPESFTEGNVISFPMWTESLQLPEEQSAHSSIRADRVARASTAPVLPHARSDPWISTVLPFRHLALPSGRAARPEKVEPVREQRPCFQPLVITGRRGQAEKLTVSPIGMSYGGSHEEGAYVSGYLQRMTAGVLNSDRAIHPLLGSIYSAATPRGTSEDRAEESVISPARTGSPAVSAEEQSDSSSVRADMAAPASTEATSSDRPLISAEPRFRHLVSPSEKAAPKTSVEPVANDRPSFQPLVTRGERRTEKLVIPSVKMNYEAGGPDNSENVPSREVATTSASNAGSFPSVTSVSGRVNNENVELASERGESFQTAAAKAPAGTVENPGTALRPYQPLLAENLRRTGPPKIFSEASNAFPGDAQKRQARRDSTPYRGRPEREPDEIQIHIGRIEVVAVPPPAAVREAKPTHKSLSLDDYLKRGNGSAR